jgi:hypothetical protein
MTFPLRSIIVAFVLINASIIGCGSDDDAPSAKPDAGVADGSSRADSATSGTGGAAGRAGSIAAGQGGGGIGGEGGQTAKGGAGGGTAGVADAAVAGQDASARQDSGTDSGTTYVPPDGEPIKADDLTWTWVDFPESKCRDGSSTGIGVSLHSASKKVMIYLEGGGACFNALTCMANLISYSKGDFTGSSAGVFNRGNTDNPVKDWNFVYVPYCSGDVHGGNTAADPGTGTKEEFRGYKNLELFLDRIVPTIKNVDQVLLTGVSAGGFGAALNGDLVARTFPPEVTFTLVDDSGPPMNSDYLKSCLQKAWRELWGFDSTFLKDCGASCPDPNNFAVDWSLFLARKYTHAKAGVISSSQDAVISLFYGFGANDCTAVIPNMAAADFEAGLMDFRTQLQSVSNFGTYYITSTSHTWLGTDNSFYNTTVGGVRLVDWVRDLLEGKTPTHVGP